MVEGEAVFVAKVVSVDVCKQWLYRITTAFHNIDRLFLRDKTTLPNCFGMNGHQKTLSFSKRKPIKVKKLARICAELPLTLYRVKWSHDDILIRFLKSNDRKSCNDKHNRAAVRALVVQRRE